MRLLILTLFLSGCFFTKTDNATKTDNKPVVDFEVVDTNNDGIITKEEHATFSQSRNLVKPYVVFGCILLTIVVILTMTGSISLFGNLKKNGSLQRAREKLLLLFIAFKNKLERK